MKQIRTIKKTEKTQKPDKLKKIVAYLDGIKESGFTGYIKINFSQGTIGRVEKFEEILKK